MRRRRLLPLVALAGCLEPTSLVCPDGTICAADLVCAPVSGCAAPERVAACDGLDEDEACDVAAQPGVCHDGVCVALVCGDGLVTGNEQCDPAVAATSTCRDRGFYLGGTIGCGPNCAWDLATCSEFCGDRILQSGEELCEIDLAPEGSCVSYGFDGGRLGCAGCGADFAGCRVIGWSDASLPDGMAVFDAVRAGDSLVAVGVGLDDGVPFVARWSGSWSILGELADDLEPTGVWAAGRDGIWITGGHGDLGFVGSWNGSGWMVEDLPQPGHDIWSAGGDEIFVLSGNGVRRWDGEAWSYTELTGDFYGKAIWGEPDGSAVYAAGAPGGLFRYDGTWSPMEAPPDQYGVTDVIGDGDGGLWAVSTYKSVYRQTPAGWDDTGLPVEPIDGTLAFDDDGNLFIVAQWSGISEQPHTGVFQHRGDSWRLLSDGLDSQLTGFGVRALGGFGREMFLFADYRGFHYGGSAWWDVSPPSVGTAIRVWGNEQATYLIAQSRAVQQLDAGGWSGAGIQGDEIDGAGDDVYVLDREDGELEHRIGDGPWQTEAFGVPSSVVGLAVRGRDDVFLLTEFGEQVQHWDGAELTPIAEVSGTFLEDIDCAEGGACAAAGGNGAFWSTQRIGSPTERNLRAVWVAPDGQVVTGGDFGTLWLHDGSGWREMKSDQIASVSSIAGSSIDDVFAAGTEVSPVLLHYDGGDDLAWLPVRLGTGESDAQLHELGFVNDALLVAGARPSLRRLERTYPW